MAQMLFCCPICGGKLLESGNRAACQKGHGFDKSKYGYYNLLLSSSGGTHGDNKDMVLARRAFLASGKYAPLSDALCEFAVRYGGCGARLIDIGCGEGYYTEQIFRRLSDAGCAAEIAAFDISKDAVRQLVKKCPEASAAVASAYQVPALGESFDLAVNVFSPFSREEIYRLLKPRGCLIMAIPEENHLFELKEILYKTPYKNEPKDPALKGFELIENERVTFKMSLSSKEEIVSLFKMTPYAYRTPREAAERLNRLDELTVTADFRLFVYRKI